MILRSDHRITRRTLQTLAALLCLACATSPLIAQPQADARQSQGRDLRPLLERRVREQPENGTAWRMLGQARLRAGDLPGATYALREAVRLSPQNAAAHFYLGQCFQQMGSAASATAHFLKTVELAPDSRYAKQARQFVSPEQFESAYQQASYEITRFDGSDEPPDVERIVEQTTSPRPVFVFLETGVLYNTNVALAPTSRDLSGPQRESLQVFLNPEIEWTLWRNGEDGPFASKFLRSGLVGAGYWNFNEPDFQAFDLQSYRTGIFLEDEWCYPGSAVVIPRVEYGFTHDEFDGVTFGNRHAVTSSLNTVWDGGDITSLTWAVDWTDYREDGDPATDTRDGLTNALVLSHSYFINRRRLVAAGGGLTLERADAGDDFTFNGIALFVDAELELNECWQVILQGSVGYRDYPNADIAPSRNEVIYRGSAQLKRRITDHLSISGVFNYDRFDSDNPAFASERIMTGIFTTLEW